MTMRPTIEVNSRAMRGIERRLRRYPEAIQAEVLQQSADLVIAEAQELAPVRTGFLRNSEFVEPNEDGSFTIGFNADYALPVHETHPTRAGFLRRAVLEHFPRIARKVLDEIVRRQRP